MSNANDIDRVCQGPRAEDPTKFQKFPQSAVLLSQSFLLPYGLALGWIIWAAFIILNDPSFIGTNAVWLGTGAFTILGRFIFFHLLVKGIVDAQLRDEVISSGFKDSAVPNKQVLRGLARYWLDVGTIGVGLFTTLLGFPQMEAITGGSAWLWIAIGFASVSFVIAILARETGARIGEYIDPQVTTIHIFKKARTITELPVLPFWAMMIRSALGFITLGFIMLIGRSVS